MRRRQRGVLLVIEIQPKARILPFPATTRQPIPGSPLTGRRGLERWRRLSLAAGTMPEMSQGGWPFRRGCALVLAGALIAAGCGSKAKTASHSAATTPSTPTTTTTASSNDCETLGINPTGMREGTCTHAGVAYVIVNENHTLKLHTLSAKLMGIRSASSLGGTTAQGRFIIASITIANGLELPQSWDRGGTQQAGLILDRTVYKEDLSAEKTSDSASCLSRSVPVGSGKTETCDVIFEVPAASAADLGRHGSGDLYIVDFGSDLSTSTAPQTVGQIRLYR